MPVGDYTNYCRCGKAIFGYGLCIECSNLSYNHSTSHDFYGNINNKYIFPSLPKKSNDEIKTPATNFSKQFKEDAKRNAQILAKIMDEPPLSESEFEDFWNMYVETLSIMNKKETLNDVYHEVIEPKPNQKTSDIYSKPNLGSLTEESLDSIYYEMIDDIEECGCDADKLLDEFIKKVDVDANQIIKPVTTSDESVADTFDRFFNDQPVQKKEIKPLKPLKRKTLVVNLYAGPGSGKSTTAAGVFFELKSRGINCELATEFVKDLVWEERHKAINNQIYIFAKQHHRITRLLGEVDVIVTDSPLLLTLVYGKAGDELLKRLAKLEHDRLWTFNCFIKRNKDYNPKGRNHTYPEARGLDIEIADMLDDENIPYEVYFGNAEGKDKIVNKILQIIGENK
jgi:hypothetical protein